jgi:hypothetical protein
MEVDATVSIETDQGLPQDLAVSDKDEDVGRQLCE